MGRLALLLVEFAVFLDRRLIQSFYYYLVPMVFVVIMGLCSYGLLTEAQNAWQTWQNEQRISTSAISSQAKAPKMPKKTLSFCPSRIKSQMQRIQARAVAKRQHLEVQLAQLSASI